MFTQISRYRICFLITGYMSMLSLASTFTFTPSGGDSGDWASSANWTPGGGPPGASDIAIVPAGKTCYVESANEEIHELRIENGATVGMRSRNLTFKNVSTTQPVLKIDGTLFLDDTSSSQPQLLIDADSLMIQSLTGSYTGLINARVTDGYGVGRIQPTGSTGGVTLDISRATLRGSIQLFRSSTRRLAIYLSTSNATLEVNHTDDLMEIGEMSDTPDRTILTAPGGGVGDIHVTAGHCRFGKAQLSAEYDGTVYLEGGTITLSEYYLGASTPCALELTGGTFRVDGLASGIGGIWLGPGSRVEVAPDAAIDWQ